MKILIDADGCPVVDCCVNIAQQYGLPCLILCDTAHEITRTGAETHIFATGADSVDYALVNLTVQGDIVITQDYGLAAMCLARLAKPMDQNGQIYDDNNIDALLLARHTARKIRSSGGKLTGPKKRKPEQDTRFAQALIKLI
ncbi:MAG: DUF188 domain-containing protein, partial [Clostridiales bacterium]